MIEQILAALRHHDDHVGASLNFTPSENRLSPLARLPLTSDLYGRYYLDDLRLFGKWAFYGGKDIGHVETNILHPCLRRMTGARHVNTRPISGINCMTVALAALTEPGDTVFAVPPAAGGHVSTQVIIESMGRRFAGIPMVSPHEVDVAALLRHLGERRPRVVYLDQSTLLFPISVPAVRDAIKQASSDTILHYDSSHLNGFILGGVCPNPLEQGADLFGGSTHKTLPGPHKGFLATNNDTLAARIADTASHFVSHHHSAETVSLALTLLEFEQCGGDRYARQIVENAQAFATRLHAAGVEVAAPERGFTACHQVWVTPPAGIDASALADTFERCGLILNVFGGLPSIDRPSFRLSLAEVTRMGATRDHAHRLAEIFADLILDRRSGKAVESELAAIKVDLSVPRYCLDLAGIGAAWPATAGDGARRPAVLPG